MRLKHKEYTMRVLQSGYFGNLRVVRFYVEDFSGLWAFEGKPGAVYKRVTNQLLKLLMDG